MSACICPSNRPPPNRPVAISCSSRPNSRTSSTSTTTSAITVTQCGRICVGTKKINLSQVFAGQNVGIKEEEDNIWLVSFMQYDIGYFDLDACRVEPVENPFGPKVLTMSPV